MSNYIESLKNLKNTMEEKELQRMLGMQLLHYLEDDTESVLTWKGNKTQLVELSCYLYYIDKVKNEYGVSVSKMEVVRRVFRRFGISAPKSIGRYSENIRKNCNTRSQTMLMLSFHEHKRSGRALSLEGFIDRESPPLR